MSHYLGLEGKRALVTGGAKGVGEAVVATLRDADVIVLAIARSRRLRKLRWREKSGNSLTQPSVNTRSPGSSFDGLLGSATIFNFQEE